MCIQKRKNASAAELKTQANSKFWVFASEVSDATNRTALTTQAAEALLKTTLSISTMAGDEDEILLKRGSLARICKFPQLVLPSQARVIIL